MRIVRIGLVLLASLAVFPGWAQDQTAPSSAPASGAITLATTTSCENSGLLDYLLPRFEKESGIRVKVVAVGTGAALRIVREGNADLVLVHDPESEEKFMAEGWGTRRYPVMYNFFWILGPKEDPAGIAGLSPGEAFKKIAESKSPFVSRGDKSGTHQKELAIWNAAGIKPSGDWYLESGQGMIESLRIAGEKQAYVLSDNATYLHNQKDLVLKPLIRGDMKMQVLFNPYSIIPVNPAKHPGVKNAEAMKLIEFFRSPATQALIAEYAKDKLGEPLFYIYGGSSLSPAVPGDTN